LLIEGMSWHDLIDDASLQRFVAGGEVASDNENDGSDDHRSNSLYDTELVEAPPAGEDNDEEEGITIVSSVPTGFEYNNTMMGYSTVLVDVPTMDGSSLSLHPDSLDSSILTETSSLVLSEVTEGSLLESTVGTDRDSDSSTATYDNFAGRSASSSSSSTGSSTGSVADAGCARTSSDRDATTIQQEEAARELFLRSNSDEDWEREKENVMRIIYAIEGDCKDPDRLLADLFDDEETFWKNRDYNSPPGQGGGRPKAETPAPVALWDIALIGAVLSLAAAMLYRAVQRGR
jgi:hypothetical protein